MDVVHAKGEEFRGSSHGSFFSLCCHCSFLYEPGNRVVVDMAGRMTADPATDPVTCPACIAKTRTQHQSLAEITADIEGRMRHHPSMGAIAAAAPASMKTECLLHDDRGGRVSMYLEDGPIRLGHHRTFVSATIASNSAANVWTHRFDRPVEMRADEEMTLLVDGKCVRWWLEAYSKDHHKFTTDASDIPTPRPRLEPVPPVPPETGHVWNHNGGDQTPIVLTPTPAPTVVRLVLQSDNSINLVPVPPPPRKWLNPLHDGMGLNEIDTERKRNGNDHVVQAVKTCDIQSTYVHPRDRKLPVDDPNGDDVAE